MSRGISYAYPQTTKERVGLGKTACEHVGIKPGDLGRIRMVTWVEEEYSPKQFRAWGVFLDQTVKTIHRSVIQ